MKKDYRRIFCMACQHIRLHFKGECLVCAFREAEIQAQREIHPEIDEV